MQALSSKKWQINLMKSNGNPTKSCPNLLMNTNNKIVLYALLYPFRKDSSMKMTYIKLILP